MLMRRGARREERAERGRRRREGTRMQCWAQGARPAGEGVAGPRLLWCVRRGDEQPGGARHDGERSPHLVRDHGNEQRLGTGGGTSGHVMPAREQFKKHDRRQHRRATAVAPGSHSRCLPCTRACFRRVSASASTRSWAISSRSITSWASSSFSCQRAGAGAKQGRSSDSRHPAEQAKKSLFAAGGDSGERQRRRQRAVAVQCVQKREREGGRVTWRRHKGRRRAPVARGGQGLLLGAHQSNVVKVLLQLRRVVCAPSGHEKPGAGGVPRKGNSYSDKM